MAEIPVRSLAYLRELSRCHDDWQNDSGCLCAEWAANAITELLFIIQVECGYGVHCPCCDESETCLPECTYAEDCPDDAEKMERLRGIMNGCQD